MEEAYPALIKVLNDGITAIREASTSGDPRLRLEKFTTELVSTCTFIPPGRCLLDTVLWHSGLCRRGNCNVASSYQAQQVKLPRLDRIHRRSHVRLSVSLFLLTHCPYSRQQNYTKTREVFSDACHKQIDWPEAIWEAWIAFEHVYGSVQQLEVCLDKVDKARYQLSVRRARVCGELF